MTATAKSSASDSFSNSFSESQGESTQTVTIDSTSRVEQCVTDSNGNTQCTVDTQLTGNQQSTETVTKPATSDSDSDSGSSSTSSTSTTTCTNNVCTTQTCVTDTTGAVTCTTTRRARRARSTQEHTALPDTKETTALPKSGAAEHPTTHTKKPTVVQESSRTNTTKNCTLDATGTESCTTVTCATDKNNNTACTTTAHTAHSKLRKAQVHGDSFISKNWAYVSDSLRLKICLPSKLPEITQIDFARTTLAAQTINEDVRQTTQGVIGSLVAPGDLVGQEFMLLNAVHFKGEWMTSFPPENTKMEAFYSLPPPAAPSGNVPMMKTVGKFDYGKKERERGRKCVLS